jgi:hypothetical protein
MTRSGKGFAGHEQLAELSLDCLGISASLLYALIQYTELRPHRWHTAATTVQQQQQQQLLLLLTYIDAVQPFVGLNRATSVAMALQWVCLAAAAVGAAAMLRQELQKHEHAQAEVGVIELRVWPCSSCQVQHH